MPLTNVIKFTEQYKTIVIHGSPCAEFVFIMQNIK